MEGSSPPCPPRRGLRGFPLMAVAILLVLLTLAVSHWFLEPAIRLLTPLLDLSWIGWILLVAALWLFAGAGGSGKER